MNKLQYHLERQISIKTQSIHPEIIEQALLTYPLVQDCRVLSKQCSSSGEQIVAYIVSKSDFSADKLHSYLQATLVDTILPIAYVNITNIPLTEVGEIDDDSLRSLTIINDNLIKAWNDELKHISALQQYIVISQDSHCQCAPLHLQHLCTKWASKQNTEEFEEIDYIEGEVSDILALSDGGPLNLDTTLPKTLSEAFLHAQKHSDSGIVYIQQDGSDEFISYADLIVKAKRIVSGLQHNGLKANDIVILQLTDLEEFVTVFWACLLAGVIPLTVAIAPTYESKNGVLDKLFNAWDLLNKPQIICSDGLISALQSFHHIYEIEQLKLLSITQLIDHDPALTWYDSQPDEIAFLQLSSGSTGVSKCIPETHRAVIAHIQAATQVNHYHSEHISLNWLPMDHVGPLLMYHVRDVFLGIKQVQIPPYLILNKPTLWLDYLQQFQVTHTW